MKNGNGATQTAGFWATVGQIVIAIGPFLFFLRIMSADVPPWVSVLVGMWGPVVPLIGILIAGFWRYFPPSVIMGFMESQREQALALNAIAYKLKEMTDAAGPLPTIQEKIAEILRHQAVIAERLRVLESIILHAPAVPDIRE